MSFHQVLHTTRVLIILNGTMGAGKTNYSCKLQSELEKLNYVVYNEGFDKYMVAGAKNAAEALEKIQHTLATIETVKYSNQNIAVIVDTCGDKYKGTDVIFGCKFSADEWTRHDIYPNYNPDDF